MIRTLGHTLDTIEDLETKVGGRYLIFVPCEAVELDAILKDTINCEVMFVTNEEDENGIYNLETELCELVSISVAREVVRNARLQKPKCTTSDLVECLQFYLDYDAFCEL